MSRWPNSFWAEGFDGRMFLTEEEWRTYLRRQAVRYPNQSYKDRFCGVCGKVGTGDNPLQLAHRISFYHGIRYLALTPEFLDSRPNLMTAHRQKCNKSVELGFQDALRLLLKHEVRVLPAFLPADILDEWRREFERDWP
jgi:hypothetical protein